MMRPSMSRKGSCCGCCWSALGKGYLCLRLLGAAETMISQEDADCSVMVGWGLVSGLTGRAGGAYANITKRHQKLYLDSLMAIHRLHWNKSCLSNSSFPSVLIEGWLKSPVWRMNPEILSSLGSRISEKSTPSRVYNWWTLKLGGALILRLSCQKWPSCQSDSDLMYLGPSMGPPPDFKFTPVSGCRLLNTP
jgi:hypothetical protein